jgi:GWxTD domain-containing protein
MRSVQRLCLGALLCVLGSCSGRSGQPGRAPSPDRSPSTITPVDAVQIYRQMGLFADNAGVPYVGRVSFLAGPADSTFVLISLSIASRALSFQREGDDYRATYRVVMNVKSGDSVVKNLTATETVRVSAFKETTRNDESVIFQQIITLKPGQYSMSLAVNGDDITRTAPGLNAEVRVPDLSTRSLSSPVPYYSAAPRTAPESLPRIIVTPRSTVVFGRDSILPVYLEAYGPGDRLTLGAGVIGEQRLTLWTDSAVTLTRHGRMLSGTINVPVSRLGIGVTTLSIWRYDTPDTVRAPVFITFGDDLPVATIDQMLSYLRFYANYARLREMRDTTPEARARLWSAFLAETDPVPDTPEHEGLRDYFQRIQVANLRFRDEGGPGWMTERGMVFVTLGEPDQVLEPTGMQMNERGRIQIWEYRNLRVTLQFVDQSGFGRWRLTPGSQAEFSAVARRVQKG